MHTVHLLIVTSFSDKYTRDTISSVTEPSKQTYRLGQSFDIRKEAGCTTKAIIVSKSNSTQTETACITLETLKASLESILNEAKDCNAKKVAIPVTLRAENLTELCMSAVLAVHKELFRFETLLFCQEHNKAKTAQEIDEHFQKNIPGYFREIFMENLSLTKGKLCNSLLADNFPNILYSL